MNDCEIKCILDFKFTQKPNTQGFREKNETKQFNTYKYSRFLRSFKASVGTCVSSLKSSQLKTIQSTNIMPDVIVLDINGQR